MSFTLDHNDIDQTNDDTDSLYIVISDEPLHQSQPAQLLTKDKLTPPYTLSIPYSPQQVDFKTAFAVHLFDVCKTEGGENKQLDFVIRENEFPKVSRDGFVRGSDVKSSAVACRKVRIIDTWTVEDVVMCTNRKESKIIKCKSCEKRVIDIPIEDNDVIIGTDKILKTKML
ncbi:2265_t:CDS:2 [Rhizophagus irregularis]|nr:2265_t:CDS:2 [Rhizophagus irregularis]